VSVLGVLTILPLLSSMYSCLPPSPTIANPLGASLVPSLNLGIGVANATPACIAPKVPIVVARGIPATGPNPIGGGAKADIIATAVFKPIVATAIALLNIACFSTSFCFFFFN